MKIYTSFYGNRKIANYIKVSISCSAPKDMVLDGKIELLAPGASILYGHKKGVISTETYTKEYLHKLNSNREIIIETMRQVWRNAKGRNIVLLCWEGKNKFCHRHLFAKWFFEQTGYQIEEL